jgi:HEAT repeat protein
MCPSHRLISFGMLLIILSCVRAEPPAEFTYEGKTVRQWRADLKHSNWDRRYFAMLAFYKMGPEAKQALPAITDALKDSEWGVRTYAAKALGKLGPEARSAVPALTAALKDTHPGARESAAEALGSIGLTDKEAEAWVAAIQGNDPEMRRLTTLVLTRLSSSSAHAVPILIGGLKSPDKSIRMFCAHGLGNIGVGAKDAVPVLAKLVEARKDEKDRAGWVALTRVLVKVEPKAGGQHAIELLRAVPATEVLKGMTPETRSSWALLLGEHGEEAKPAVGFLIELLKDPDRERVRSSAAEALLKIGVVAIPELFAAGLGNSNPEFRRHIMNILEEIDRRKVNEFLERELEERQGIWVPANGNINDSQWFEVKGKEYRSLSFLGGRFRPSEFQAPKLETIVAFLKTESICEATTETLRGCLQ